MNQKLKLVIAFLAGCVVAASITSGVFLYRQRRLVDQAARIRADQQCYQVWMRCVAVKALPPEQQEELRRAEEERRRQTQQQAR